MFLRGRCSLSVSLSSSLALSTLSMSHKYQGLFVKLSSPLCPPARLFPGIAHGLLIVLDFNGGPAHKRKGGEEGRKGEQFAHCMQTGY